MSAKVLGVILGQSRGTGIVLLCHRSAPSLAFVIDEYLDTNSCYQLWLAEFDPKFTGCSDNSKRAFARIVGQVVHCSVVKRDHPPKRSASPWLATAIEFAHAEPRHELPNVTKQLKERRSSRRRPTDRPSQRLSRMNQAVPDNLRRPWRG